MPLIGGIGIEGIQSGFSPIMFSICPGPSVAEPEFPLNISYLSIKSGRMLYMYTYITTFMAVESFT